MTALRQMNHLTLPVLTFCSFLVGFDAIVTVPLIPAIAQATDMPIDLGGLLYVSYALAYTLAAPVVGTIADRWNKKWILLIGLLVFAAATAMVGFSSTFAALLIFRVLSGIGASMIEPTVFAIVGDMYAYEKRGRAMGIITAALISSAVIGVPLGGYLADWLSWNWTFWLIACLTMIVIVLILPSIPTSSSNQNGQTNEANALTFSSLFQSFRSAFGNPSVLASLSASFLYYGGLQGLFVLSGVYYFTFYDLSAGQTGLVLMLAGVGSVLGSMIGGKTADKTTKKSVVLLATLMTAIFVLSLTFLTTTLWLSILVHFLWATFYGVGQAALTALVSELNPKTRATVMSLNSSAMYAGAGVLSAVAAVLLRNSGFYSIGLICAAVNVLMLFIVLFAIHEKKSRDETI
jgi:multidrug resistance protein